MTKKKNKNFSLSIVCCNNFEKLVSAFTWMSYRDEDKKDTLLMPHYEVDDNVRLRVNHCPVCGQDVRAIEMKVH